jgi:asparagine synthetase B (glutamine-hydrolysing)
MSTPIQQSSILLHQGRLIQREEDRLVTTERYEIAWRGFVYLDGVASGEASLRRFAEEIEGNLAAAAEKLKGVYFIAVRDKLTDRAYAFVDNSALFHSYVSPQFVGTSFLEIVSLKGLRPDDLDPDSIVEFLQFGCVYFGKTFFNSVKRIDADVIVESRPDGSVAFLPKPIPDISEVPKRSLEQMLESLCRSIAHERVSVDLTGGIDSRLIAVLLSYFGLQFDFGLSASAEIEDVCIAREVASVLNRDLFLTPHAPQQTRWDDLFSITDGLFDLAKSDRPIQMQRQRAARGVTLAVSGTGGELFKDFWWLQDFPFYKLKNPNLERLYDVRFAPGKAKTSNMGPRYCSAAASLRQRMIASWSAFRAGTNTETYDRIYYGLKMREFAGRGLTNTSKILPTFSPYVDHEAVSIGYNLDRSDRFFNRFHRAVITKYSRQAAKIRTTEGQMTASIMPVDVSQDLIKYVANRLSRLKTKLDQRRGVALRPQEGPDHPQLGRVLRDFAAQRRTIQRLQDHGILNQNASNQRLDAGSIGSLLPLDILLERLEAHSPAQLNGEISLSQAI